MEVLEILEVVEMFKIKHLPCAHLLLNLVHRVNESTSQHPLSLLSNLFLSPNI